jgi:O-6-methylguanine DNA methyltransferase
VPARRDYSASDHVKWGICSYADFFATLVEDEAGIVVLGIGLSSRDEAEKYALLSISRHWPDGAASIKRDDYRAGEVFAAAMRGQPHPLHMALTPYQESVLRATCTIPRGEVRTYAWVAAQAGHPKATRAAANALHNNPVAIIVPCHRVVPSTGEVGGYACGTALKARFLKAEGVPVDDRNSLVLPRE